MQQGGVEMSGRTLLVLIFLVCSQAMPGLALDKQEAEKQIKVLNRKIIEANEQNNLQDAIEAAEDALTVARLGFGEESVEAAKAMNNVGNLYMFSRHPQEASELYKAALEIERKKVGEKSVEAADTLNNLAVAYAMQGKFDDARASLKEVIDIRAKKLGKDNPETIKAGEMLAEL
jgi:tetratricopeptide (TPR) repeat protein